MWSFFYSVRTGNCNYCLQQLSLHSLDLFFVRLETHLKAIRLLFTISLSSCDFNSLFAISRFTFSSSVATRLWARAGRSKTAADRAHLLWWSLGIAPVSLEDTKQWVFCPRTNKDQIIKCDLSVYLQTSHFKMLFHCGPFLPCGLQRFINKPPPNGNLFFPCRRRAPSHLYF